MGNPEPALVAGIHAGCTLGFAMVVYIIRRGNCRKFPSDWFVGWVAFGVSVGSFAAAGVATWVRAMNPVSTEGVAVLAGGVGWLSGNLIGDFIWWHYRREINGDEDERWSST